MTHQPDNWGWRARIGIFIVGNEAVPEAEWWAMVPPGSGISIHAARVTARAPWAKWRADRSGVDLEDDVIRACRQFAAMRLSAAVIGHSSSSILGGAGWDEAVVGAMTPLLASTTVATTNGLDSLAAMRAMNIRRPFVVFPAWFNDATVAAGVAYHTAHGVTPAGHLRYDPGRKWRDVPFAQLYPEGMGFEQETEPLYAQIRAACPASADGIYIAGTGFRCVGIIDALEQDLKRPVLTANQVSLWHCLRLSGAHVRIESYGSLFAC